MTATSMSVNGVNLNPSGDTAIGPLVQFQIGYPYLGFAKDSWTEFQTLMFDTWNPDLANKLYCNTWNNNEFCFWRNTECSEVNAPGDFSVVLGEYDYTIPMAYMLADTMQGTRHDCDVFIT